jgi:hypothetical protein
VLFLHNTSRVEDEKYPTLLQDKGFGGFPSLCFMSAEGEVLAKPGRSVDGFVTTHADVQALAKLQQKKDRTAAEEKQLFLAELKLDLVPAEQIQARADQLGLDDAEKKVVAAKLVDREVKTVLDAMRKDGPKATAAKCAEIAQAGKEPSEAMAGIFWSQVLTHASGEKDAKLAARAHGALMARYGKETSPGIERQKKAWQDLLDAANAK